MREIETEMQTRVRQGNRDEDRTTGNLVWAEFIHTTSRPIDGVPDPHLHAHVFAFNATWDEREQQWKAGQFRALKRDAPYFQAAFRARLANHLQDLGFGVERKRDDFEIAGVPAALLPRYSRRTEAIEKVAADKGITDPKRKDELGALTREKKSHDLSWEQLRKEWDSRLTQDERNALAAVHRRETRPARPGRGEGAAVDHALAHCFVREAVVPERHLLTEALKRGVGAVTVEDVRRELAGRPLIRGLHAGRAVATTKEMKAAEARLIAFARDGRGRFRPLGDPDRPIARHPFNAGQVAAVRHVLGSRDAVTIVRGAAGTGKTTLEDELRRALAAAQVPVAALAQSTTAVQELRDQSGFHDAVTLAHFFQDTTRQAAVRGGLVLVDEASQIGTRDLGRLFDLAREAGARVVLVGDKRQHRSVSAGEPLRLLEQQAGLPVAEVTEIVRQEHGDYRQAARALGDGRTADGFAALDRLKWIKEVPDGERYRALADAYLATTREKNKKGEPRTALAVSPTWAEAGQITQAIRTALKQDGKLGEERTLPVWVPAHLTEAQKADPTHYGPGDLLVFHANAPGHVKGSRLIVSAGDQLPLAHAGRFEVYRPAHLGLAVGDRVRITANGKTRDGRHKLRNGALYTVRGFTPPGEPVVEHGWAIGNGHLAHGYAVTSHAAQGRTVSKVFIGLSSQSFPAATRRSFYVAVTRGQEQAVVFTDDKQELLRVVQRPDQPLSATELARAQRRRPPLRQRLRALLAYRRRLAVFAQTHEYRRPAPERAPERRPEVRHAR